ncbi:MAG: tetratricopeptide repeat protein [Lyngbya sp.]|nr:tetratricopeptide repeat protein [Lyngbya sp.]
MKFSNVAFLTLAALIAQDSMSEASSVAEARLSTPSGIIPETNPQIDPIETNASLPQPSVSTPEMFMVQEFSPSVSSSKTGEFIVASAVQPLSRSPQLSHSNQQKFNQVLSLTWLALLVETFSNRSSLSSNVNLATANTIIAQEITPDQPTDSQFNHTITLLNSLLIVAILSPVITMAFFWLLRRLVIREFVAEANRSLNRVDSLEQKITDSSEQSKQLAQELEAQIKVTQDSIDFLKREASASQASIEELKQLQLNLIQTLQKIKSEFQTKEQSNLIRFPLVNSQTISPRNSQVNLKNSSGFEEIFQLDSSTDFIADDYLKQGEALANENRYSEALTSFEKAIKMNPNLEEAWYNQGNILVRFSRYTEALKSYEKALEINSKKYEAWYNRGNVLVKLKRYSEALESYDRALSIQPKDDEAWHNRGVLLRKFKRYNEALDSYDKALEIQPNKYETWHNRGNVLGKLKRYSEAIISYDRAITIDAGKREVWLNRAVALCKLKHYDQAIASFEQAIGLDPTSPELWNMRASLLQQLGQYSEAIASFETAIQHKPDCYEAWLGKGSVLVQLKQYSEALSTYEKAISIQPEASEAWRHQGLLLEKLERYPDAIAAYDQAIKLQPNDAEAWRFRGALLSKLKNYQEAISSLGKAISIQKELRSVKIAATPEQQSLITSHQSPVI